MKLIVFILLFYPALIRAEIIYVGDYGVEPNRFDDVTEGVQKAINDCAKYEQCTLVFPEGRYDFWPDKAVETHYYISNTSSETEVPVKRQRVGLFFKNQKNIRLEGNNAVFVFHGKMITWVIDSCENIQIQNLSVDYERPGMSEMTLKAITPESVIAEIHPDSRFAIIHGRLTWYGEKWLTENYHAILVRPSDGMMLYSDWRPFERSRAEKIAPLTVKFTGDFSTFKAQQNDVLTIRDRYRDYVGAFHNRSKNIRLSNVHMNSMHGLGIVSQFSEDLTYDSVFVEPAKGSGRVISSSADGMHFSGCRGQITITHCRFRGMHDDPVNVHGTHLKITEIISSQKLKVRFMHHQTYGFPAFIAADSVAFLHAASLRIYGTGRVKSARLVSEREMILEMESSLPKALREGDAIENTTWTPSVTIRHSRFEGTNTRGTLITTRRKVIIENNEYYRTGMHAILIANDASDWYESGPVMDVTIRNNRFIECGYNSAPDNYIIKIDPAVHQPTTNHFVHHHILIENNFFKVYDFPVLFAAHTENLTFSGNQIERTEFLPAGKSRSPVHFKACNDITVQHNRFDGLMPEVSIEEMKKKTIKTDLHNIIIRSKRFVY